MASCRFGGRSEAACRYLDSYSLELELVETTPDPLYLLAQEERVQQGP